MNTRNAESTVPKKSLKRIIKGIILIERPQFSIISLLCALAGIFLAARGNISGLNFWLVIKVCILFWFMTNTAHALNDYFDREADKTGRPRAPIPAGLLSLKQVKVIIVANYIIGIILILALSPNYITALFALIHLFMGFIYSTPPIRMCNKAIGGAVTISIGAFMIPLLGGWSAIAGGNYEHTLLLFCLAYLFLALAARMPADIADMTGDKHSGRATLPLQIGITKAYYVACSTAFLGICLFLVAFFVSNLNIYYIPVWALSTFLFIFTLLKFKKELNEKAARKYSEKLLLPILLSAIAIIVGAI